MEVFVLSTIKLKRTLI